MGAIESEWLSSVHKLPCVVCGAAGPVEAHHIRAGQGMAQCADDFCTVPLCFACHRGRHGIHGDRGRWKGAGIDEIGALGSTIKLVALMILVKRGRL